MYKKLIELNKADKISFKYVKTFNMDEYVGKIKNFIGGGGYWFCSIYIRPLH